MKSAAPPEPQVVRVALACLLCGARLVCEPVMARCFIRAHMDPVVDAVNVTTPAGRVWWCRIGSNFEVPNA